MWDGRSPYSSCAIPPDKETPLWAPDEAPIYDWSGEEISPCQAFAVNYAGGIGRHSTAMDSMGFRCVKPAGTAR